MNALKLTLLLGLFVLNTTHAADSYEASFEDISDYLSEPLTLEVEPKETWALHFELQTPKGETKILTQQNTSVLLKPASTMKLFTGWWSFQEASKSDGYLYKMLRRSDNNMAETIAQELGGVLTMQDWFIEQGLPLDPTNFIAADGSGLSYDNRSNCDIQIQLLRKIKKDKNYSRFKRLLAQPGRDGTLEKRLTKFSGRLFAKTGTLKRTAALTGFVETPRGTMLFCVLSDYLNTNLTNARKRIDNLVSSNYAKALKVK